MPQQVTGKPPLSPHWAFVVHLRVGTTVTRKGWSGRVEHVVSGQTTHFESLAELLGFMRRVLATMRAPPPEPPSGSSKQEQPHNPRTTTDKEGDTR